MAQQEKRKPSREDFNRPMPKQKPLAFLPEREWLYGVIEKCEYEYCYFNNQPQYVTDQGGNQILDEAGEPIHRRQFAFEIHLRDHLLQNGDPRRVWFNIGASMGAKANLPKLLMQVGITKDDVTPGEVILCFEKLAVKFQMANKVKENGEEYQKVLWDSIKPSDPTRKIPGSEPRSSAKTTTKSAEEIAWDE